MRRSHKTFFLNPQFEEEITYSQFWDDLLGHPHANQSSSYLSLLRCFEGLKLESPSHDEVINFIEEHGADISLISSGTTTIPKRIDFPLKHLLVNTSRSAKYLNNIWGLTFPLNRMAGIQVMLQAFANENTLVNLVDLSFSEVRRTVNHYGITHLSATPTFYRMLTSDGSRFMDVQQITSGGECLDRATVEQLRAAFPKARITNIYASTEAGTILKSNDEIFSIPQTKARLFKIKNSELLIHRSLLGYQSAAGALNFFATGDLVEVLSTDPLKFKFSGRCLTNITVGGNQVNPEQVENLLISREEIIDAKVYGRPNSVIGNIVCCDLLIKPEMNLTPHQIRNWLTNKLPAYAIPRIIQIVDDVTCNRSGKKVRK